jgi:hypothetical protein
LLQALLFTWFQEESVLLRFPDDVFLLHFSLETAESALQRLAFLYYYDCQFLNLLNL